MLIFFSPGKLSNTSTLIMGHYLEIEAVQSKTTMTCSYALKVFLQLYSCKLNAVQPLVSQAEFCLLFLAN